MTAYGDIPDTARNAPLTEDGVKARLAKAKALHGTEDGFFGFTYDYSEEIEELTALINEIESDFIIV